MIAEGKVDWSLRIMIVENENENENGNNNHCDENIATARNCCNGQRHNTRGIVGKTIVKVLFEIC